MAGFNKVIMMGNLTRDPDLKFLPNQTAVVEISIATNRKWTSKDGVDKEEVCFVNCKCFGKMAETIGKFFTKAKPIHIEGRLSHDRWEDKDGNKREKHYITIENFIFVNDGSGGGAKATSSKTEPVPVAVGADDIPF